MKALRGRGVERIVLLSGDTQNATQRVADSPAIDEWRARMSPQQKAHFVRDLKKAGHRVAVVGDGVNDSVAAAPIAVGLGTAVASGINPAVAAFLSNSLTVVAAANRLRPLLQKGDSRMAA